MNINPWIEHSFLGCGAIPYNNEQKRARGCTCTSWKYQAEK